MSGTVGMGGWWRRVRLSGWKVWKLLWRPQEEEEEEDEEDG